MLVIGAETLSRVSDPHDVDAMIFADGAGATLLESRDEDGGILSHVTRTDALDNAWMLRLGPSYHPEHPGDERFIKMDGHEIYKYALKTVPRVVKQALEGREGRESAMSRKSCCTKPTEKWITPSCNGCSSCAGSTPSPKTSCP